MLGADPIEGDGAVILPSEDEMIATLRNDPSDTVIVPIAIDSGDAQHAGLVVQPEVESDRTFQREEPLAVLWDEVKGNTTAKQWFLGFYLDSGEGSIRVNHLERYDKGSSLT